MYIENSLIVKGTTCRLNKSIKRLRVICLKPSVSACTQLASVSSRTKDSSCHAEHERLQAHECPSKTRTRATVSAPKRRDRDGVKTETIPCNFPRQESFLSSKHAPRTTFGLRTSRPKTNIMKLCDILKTTFWMCVSPSDWAGQQANRSSVSCA